MALRLKYFGQDTCTETGDVIRFEIHEKGHLGGAAERRLVENGVVMSTDGPGSRDHYKPLLTNTAECLLWDENGDIAAALETATDFSHKLFIYRNDIIEFVGWLRVEPVASTLNAFPGQIVVSAVCGLALLKNIPFLDDADLLFTGQISFKNLIWNCLKKLDVGLDFYLASNWWVPSLATGETDPEPLEWLFTYAETFLTTNGDPVSCEQVLIEVMKAFNLQIRQGRGAWHVVQRELLFSGTYHRRKYDIATGGTTAVGDFNPAQTLTEAQAQALREWGGQKTYLPGLQAAQVRFVYDELPTVIENGDLSGVQSPRAAPGPRDTSRAGFRGGVRPGGGSGPRGGRVGRGGGARGRGQDPAGFAGRGNRTTPSTNRRLNWFDKSDVAITASDVGDGQGPNGENILFQDPVAAGSVAAVTSSYPDYLTEVEAGAWHYVEGRVVNGGTDKKLRVEVSTFLDESGNQEPNGVFYPVHYKVRLNNIDTGAFKWLSLSLDVDDYHTWSDPEVALNFLGPSGLLNDTPARNGVEGEVWTTDIRLSEDIPSGAWRVRVYLFPCFDWQRRGVASGPHPLKTTKGQKWTNVFVDLLVEGEYDRTSEIRTALDAASDHTMLFGLDCVLGGPAPFFDMAGSVVHATDQVGDNWKINRYAGEGDTGISLTEINAKALFRQQGEIVEVQRANIHPTTDDYFLLAPHEVLEIDGDRFQLGTINYNYLSGAWGGQFIRIRQVADAPTVDILNERDTGFFRFGGAPVGAFVSNADGVFNRSQQNAIAKTDDVIQAGLRTQITVTDMKTAVEANDKIIMIDALGNDYQFTLTANKAIGATTWDIDDDALLGAGFNFPRNVDYPAGLFLREAFIRSAFIQTRDSIRAVVRGDEVCRLNETISTPTVRTSATVTPLLVALVDNDELELINEGSDTPTKLTVNGAHAKSATTLNFDSQTIEGTTNDSIKLDGAWLRAELTIQKDEIDLRVTKEFYDDRQGSLVARLNGAQSGVKTSIVVEWANLESGTGTHFKLKVGEVIKIIHASDPDIVQYVRVTADEVAGSISIAVADAADSTATNVTLLSFADESMVYLHQAVPEVVTTGINITLGSIFLDSDLIHVKTNAEIKNAADGSWDWRITEKGYGLKTNVNAASRLEERAFDIVKDDGTTLVGSFYGYDSGGSEVVVLAAENTGYDLLIKTLGAITNLSIQAADDGFFTCIGNLSMDGANVDLSASGTLLINNLVGGLDLELRSLEVTVTQGFLTTSAGGYHNFGATKGAGGYGVRDSGGNMQFKNSGGAWSAFGGGATSITDDVIPKGTGSGIEDSNWSITDAGILSSVAAGVKFGIGTAAPGHDLEVQATNNTAFLVSLHNTNTGSQAAFGILEVARSGDQANGTGCGIALSLLNNSAVLSEFAYFGVEISDVIAGSEDGDLILSTTAAGSVRQERVRILADGNVGIGTMAPGSKLEVNGEIRASQGLVSAPSFSFDNDTDTGIYRSGVNNLGFATNGIKQFEIRTTNIEFNLVAQGLTGSATTPQWSFVGDADTGMYNSATNTLAFATAGVLRLDINSSNIVSTLPFYVPFGSVGAPSFSFASDSDTGMYNSATNTLAFTTGALDRLYISFNGLISTVRFKAPFGSVTGPSFTFDGDIDTGMYRSAVNSLGFSTNGIRRLEIRTTTIEFVLVATGETGNATNPAWSFTGDSNTGMYNSAVDTLAFTTGGIHRFDINTVAVTSSLEFRGPNGTPASPAYTFETDQDTGMYLITTNHLGFSVGGGLSLDIDAVAITFGLELRATPGDVLSPAYTFETDQDTGMYRSGVNNLGFATNGILRFEVRTTNIEFNLVAQGLSGNATTPAWSFVSDANTGMYNVAANQLGFATGGILRLDINATRAKFANEVEIDGTLNHDGLSAGFYGTTPILKQLSVPVTAAGVHAALVNLGFIT